MANLILLRMTPAFLTRKLSTHLVVIEVETLERVAGQVVVTVQRLEVQPLDLKRVHGITGSCHRLSSGLIHGAQAAHFDQHSDKAIYRLVKIFWPFLRRIVHERSI